MKKASYLELWLIPGVILNFASIGLTLSSSLKLASTCRPPITGVPSKASLCGACRELKECSLCECLGVSKIPFGISGVVDLDRLGFDCNTMLADIFSLSKGSEKKRMFSHNIIDPKTLFSNKEY